MSITRTYSVVVLDLPGRMNLDALSSWSENRKDKKEKVKECEC